MTRVAIAVMTMTTMMSGGALAADIPAMPVKAPPAAVAAVASWSGFYVGGSGGWARTEVKGDYVTSPTVNHHNADGTSGIAGGFVGVQYQWNQVVLGVEAHFSGVFKDWAAASSGPTPACVVTSSVSCRGSIDQLFTVGPRVGFAASNQWLLFATGGFASARLETSAIGNSTGLEVGHSSLRHNGWFAGGGVDYAITPNWIASAEYQHIALRARRHFDDYFGGCCTITAETRDMKGSLDIVRLRLAYKVGLPR